MTTPLRVVILAANTADAEQLAEILGRADFSPDWLQVDNLADFHLALEPPPDLALVVYRLASFDALEAVQVLEQRGLELPLIVVSDLAGEDLAVEAMKRGAADYILRDRLPRLGEAVHQALALRQKRQQSRREEAARHERAERHALALRGTNDGIWDWTLRTDRIYLSPRWKEMLGYTDDEIGDSPDEWFGRVDSGDLVRLKDCIAMHLRGLTPHFEDEHRMLHRDGAQRWMRSRGLAVRDENDQPYRLAGSLTDITEHKRLELQLLHDAFHDRLTGLPNRALFLDRLEHIAGRARRHPDHRYAVLFLDLDRFKQVNDTYGHPAGDQFLAAVARRLERCLRATDTVARFGGDEFAILLDDITQANDVTYVTDRIKSELHLPVEIDSHQVICSVSIGIAINSPERPLSNDLLLEADRAMYRSKALLQNMT